MDLRLYWQMVKEVEEERAGLQRSIAVTRESSILAETLAFGDVAEEWRGRPLEWRRAIIKLCVGRIVVEPVGKTTGAQKGRSGFALDPGRVRMKFTDEEA